MDIMKLTGLVVVAGFGVVACGSAELLSAVTDMDANVRAAESLRFEGKKDGQECSLDLTVENGQITSFVATGLGSTKAIDIFGNCDGGWLYPCSQEGVLKSGILGVPFGDAESFASVSWESTTFSAGGFELKGRDESSDSTRKIRLAFDGSSFTFKETVSIDGIGLLVAAEQKTACEGMVSGIE